MRNIYRNPQTNNNTLKYTFERRVGPFQNAVVGNTQGFNSNQPNLANNVNLPQPVLKEERRYRFSAQKHKNEPDVH